MAPPRKRSKRRRAPNAQPARARSQPPAGKPPAGRPPGQDVPRLKDTVGAVPPEPALEPDDAGVDEADLVAPEPLAGPDGPTLGDVDLAAGAPPEDLGVPTVHPPADLAIVTGELPDEDADEESRAPVAGDDFDADGEAEDPSEEGRARRSQRFGDRLDAEDELLPAARNVKGRAPATTGGNRVTTFLRASWAELQRVQWPNRRQVGQATAVVLGFVVIAGGYLGLADLISSNLVDAIL
ncbi:MAG: preprotein translocase subunit SecE [Solirubrobacteraceae bacterium]|nr:preprotein translocase subunit SecE [Solirubrobacteraceae bacterium]